MRIKKTDKVRRLIAEGNYIEALGIARGFSRDVAKDDLSKIALAYECMVYQHIREQHGKDAEKALLEGIQILKDLYGQDE